jgi:predicted helicase
MQKTIKFYNLEVSRYKLENKSFGNASEANDFIDNFVNYDDNQVSWSRRLKQSLKKCHIDRFSADKIRSALYRPFSKMYFFFDRLWDQEIGRLASLFPNFLLKEENIVICLTGVAASQPFATLVTKFIPCADCLEKTQCFPFYTYDEQGSQRQENITDWALEEYRRHYQDQQITKWDIFYYIYGVLHHPQYRERYAANLRRELPRIPYLQDFRTISTIGRKLADLHVNYEELSGYELEKVENPDVTLNWQVEKMRLSKDRQSIIYNDFLTLAGIPLEVFEYKLGNRSALEWIIEEYQVSKDKRSGIINDPNWYDDPQYIVRLVEQVVAVSVATVQLIKSLPVFEIKNV